MPSIPNRIPLIERSIHGGIFILYYKRKPVSHVSQGTVIDSLARKRSKEAYGVCNIEDAYFLGVYLVGFLKQFIYVRLLYWLIFHIFGWRLTDSSVLNVLVLTCIVQALAPGREKALEQLQHAQKENKWCGSHNQMWIAMLMSPEWAK